MPYRYRRNIEVSRALKPIIMIKIKRSKDNQFYFTVHAKNGRVLLTSETYKHKNSARIAINTSFRIFSRQVAIPILDTTAKKAKK